VLRAVVAEVAHRSLLAFVYFGCHVASIIAIPSYTDRIKPTPSTFRLDFTPSWSRSRSFSASRFVLPLGDVNELDTALLVNNPTSLSFGQVGWQEASASHLTSSLLIICIALPSNRAGCLNICTFATRTNPWSSFMPEVITFRQALE